MTCLTQECEGVCADRLPRRGHQHRVEERGIGHPSGGRIGVEQGFRHPQGRLGAAHDGFAQAWTA
ncbi:hypothetical protein J7F02_04980 [Streptomyces sp. ISL-112]|nr:hypothetical protein [Streptomyces sp. ISL-112]MBT2460286.1 hypothetical protein [Streptomyces sp. ISL-63]